MIKEASKRLLCFDKNAIINVATAIITKKICKDLVLVCILSSVFDKWPKKDFFPWIGNDIFIGF
jgi:hypothetical protein